MSKLLLDDITGLVFDPAPQVPAVMSQEEIILAIAQIMQDETDADGELSADGEAAVENLMAMLEDSPEEPPAGRYSAEPTRFAAFDEGVPLEPLPPLEALDYFRRLYPRLGFPDRWADTFERDSFTLAVATDTVLLDRVQGVLAKALEQGTVGQAQEDIEAILDAAGVGNNNAAYAENIVRTNLHDSYSAGSQRQLNESAEVFPAWRYSNPNDGRSRPAHAEKDGKLYPTSATFFEVRGTADEDVFQCRCVQIPVDKYELADLVKAGARVEVGPPW